MRTTGRVLGVAALAAALAVATGCGDKGGDAKNEQKPDTPATPGGGDPPKTDSPKNPAPPAAAWEMDTLKHAIPAAPVAGTFGGAAFAPEVQLQGGTLRFRTFTKDGGPDKTIELRLIEPGKKLEGRKLLVTPGNAAGPDVPVVLLLKPDAKDPPLFEKGYALTLELGPKQGGKVPGKVYLSLPTGEKDFLAGTFAAEYVRTEDEPPGPDDAPFIQGKLSVAGAADPNVVVGYVRVEPYDPAAHPYVDLTGTILKPGGFPIRSETSRPRAAVLIPPAKPGEPARFEFTHLEPGRYWVFATVQGGPAVGKWVTVAAGGQVAADFALDAAAFGGLEVTVPGPAEKVYVLPAAEAGKPWPEQLVLTAAAMSGMSAGEPDPAKKDTVVPFAKLSPGKYEIWAGNLTGTVEVKRGETAKLTLTPAKK